MKCNVVVFEFYRYLAVDGRALEFAGSLADGGAGEGAGPGVDAG